VARIRTIKPSFYVSESLAEVSLTAERTFGGLITQVDDAGRIKDNAAVLHGAIWALRPEHTPVDVETDLMQLEKAGLICRYVVGGKRYLHLVTFSDHQKISHATPSKLPDCPHEIHGGYLRDQLSSGDFPSSSGASPEPSGDSPIGSGLGSGSGSGSGSPSEAPPPLPLAPLAESTPSFEDFWEAWPRKTSKADAEKAWKKALRERANPAAIVEACKSYAERCRLTDRPKDKTPYPATWLNRKSWTDDLDEDMPLGPGTSQAAATPPPMPPHCGHCDPATRWYELPDGTYDRCPECHPDYVRSRT